MADSFVVIAGPVAAGKTTLGKELFCLLTGIDPCSAWQRGSLFVACGCGAYSLAGKWPRGAKTPGGDFMAKADSKRAAVAAPGILITAAYRFTVDLRADPMSRIVYLDPGRAARRDRIAVRGTTPDGLDVCKNGGLTGQKPALTLTDLRTPRALAEEVAAKFGMQPCPCAARAEVIPMARNEQGAAKPKANVKVKVAAKAEKVKAGPSQPANLHSAQVIPVAQLKAHPKNYRKHPEGQLAHIIASIKANGFYRNVVVARDWTILAGHGVVEAAKQMGMVKVPVVRLDVDADDPRALKLLAGDNEVGRLAEVDNLLLADIFKSIPTIDLSGTGFDAADVERLLAAVGDPVDVNAEWAGMPEFQMEDKGAYRQIIVSFKSDEDAEKFAALLGQSITKDTRALWYPEAEIIHVADIRHVSDKVEGEEDDEREADE